MAGAGAGSVAACSTCAFVLPARQNANRIAHSRGGLTPPLDTTW
jgi:hypothetical protein